MVLKDQQHELAVDEFWSPGTKITSSPSLGWPPGAKTSAPSPEVTGPRAGIPHVTQYELEFYEDENGDKPVLRWIREELTRTQRFALGQAMRQQLQQKGVGVCGTAYGKQLGKGLFERHAG